MRIILINHYAGSPRHGMEYRPYYMAREWIAAGHQVSVVAATHSHVRRVNPSKASVIEEIDGISYRWVPTHAYSGNGLKRFVNMLQFVGRLFFQAPSLARLIKPDVVIASSTYPLDIIAAHRLSRLSGAKLIFEIHDLWPLSPIEIGGMSPFNPFIMLMQWAENYALRYADQVVSMLPYTKPYLLSHGMAGEKFHYIPNGFYPDDLNSATQSLNQDALDKLHVLRRKYPFLIGYAGSHGAANALTYFINAAPILEQHGIGLVLLGHGPEKDLLVRNVAQQKWANILFLDPIPKQQMPAFFTQISAAYIGLKNLNLFQYGVSPNKLFDYMMAERPVIHAINTKNNLVTEAQCGLTVQAEDTVSLAAACIHLRNLPEEERREMGARGRTYALKNHDYGLLAKRFEHVLSA